MGAMNVPAVVFVFWLRIALPKVIAGRQIVMMQSPFFSGKGC
jgi:hypothetical protein